MTRWICLLFILTCRPLFSQPPEPDVQTEKQVTKSYIIGHTPRFGGQYESVMTSSLNTNDNLSDPFGGGDPFAGDPFGGGPTPSRNVSLESDLPWARKTANPEFLKQYISHHLGITFPEGSWISYQRAGHILHMHNTEANHAWLRFGLIQNRYMEYNIQLTLRMITFPDDLIDPLDRKHPAGIPDAELISLWQSGKGKTLSSQNIKTINGVNAIIQCVEEIRYPTEIDAVPPSEDEKRKQSDALKKVYGGVETRSVGAILNVNPTVSQNLNRLNLVLLPEVASLKGNNPLHPEELQPITPIFKSMNVTTSVVIENGSSQIIGISTDIIPNQWVVLILGASLTDESGHPMRIPVFPPTQAPENTAENGQ
jgi:hypothetical protein